MQGHYLLIKTEPYEPTCHLQTCVILTAIPAALKLGLISCLSVVHQFYL
jgi:hypothetical protein